MTGLHTLPDLLREDLGIVSIGLNPSLPSVKAGYYFANPRNRFWRALQGSGLVPVTLQPGSAAMQTLFREYAIGFTDVVKRPTAGGHALRAADYRCWAPQLKQKLEMFAPAIAWFHGKQAYAGYLRYAEGVCPAIDWGEQSLRPGGSRVYVTPNPSPANAAYSLAELVSWYARLAGFRERLARGG